MSALDGLIDVSPGFRLRPSLSVATVRQLHLAPSRVAGVQTPAFVERRSGPGWLP